jgi:hypothetical protein
MPAPEDDRGHPRKRLVLGVHEVAGGSSPAKSNAGAAPGRYLVIAKSAADYAAMREQVASTGADEVLAMPAINTVVVVADLGAVSALSTNSHVKIVAPDRVEHLIRPGLRRSCSGRRCGRATRSAPSVRPRK